MTLADEAAPDGCPDAAVASVGGLKEGWVERWDMGSNDRELADHYSTEDRRCPIILDSHFDMTRG